jgi:glycine/D-amino acid oxidase-like deaminating enzyme
VGDEHRIRDRSLWLDTCDDDLTPRPPLPGDTSADVAVVGGGFTGLWTALALREAAPDCRVIVLEAEVCGFGASGRNGGWCSALLPVPLDRLARAGGRDRTVAMQREMIATVHRVGDDLRRLGVDAHVAKGGTLVAATNPAHVGRLRRQLDELRRWGFGPPDNEWLRTSEAKAHVRAAGTIGGAWTPHCAAMHPGRAVRGLARAVEAAGAVIHEGTRVTAIEPGRARTPAGTVRADTVLRCTEGYTPGLDGHHRDLVPVYSLMIATEPLDDDTWLELGFARRETFSDGRHLLIYAQRTQDGRLALGGRGAPYHFGSRICDGFDRDERVADALRRTMWQLFPTTRDARVTHHWGGPLGVPRDWCPSVGLDRATGLGWAGGYVGDGVATTHLAGRTLADLVLGRDTELVTYPWVQHRSPRWEPEPLRWIGINAGRRLAATADRREARRLRASRGLDRILGRLTGH